MSMIERLKGIFTKPVAMVVVVVIAIGVTVGFFTSRRRQSLETQAQLTLKMIGSAQLAYQDTNISRDFGSFNGLRQSEFLLKEATPDTLAPGYTFGNWHFELRGRNHYGLPDSTYTVIALPKRAKNRLRTFAICDGQIVRVATDSSSRKRSLFGAAPCDWEPLR